jgi:hypothetical protein
LARRAENNARELQFRPTAERRRMNKARLGAVKQLTETQIDPLVEWRLSSKTK